MTAVVPDAIETAFAMRWSAAVVRTSDDEPAVGAPDDPRRHGRGAVNGVRTGRSLREQWAAAGAFRQRASARVQVAERLEHEPAAAARAATTATSTAAARSAPAAPTKAEAPAHRIGELSFADLLAGALEAYREE